MSDLLRKCSQKKPVMAWEKQDRKRKKANQHKISDTVESSAWSWRELISINYDSEFGLSWVKEIGFFYHQTSLSLPMLPCWEHKLLGFLALWTGIEAAPIAQWQKSDSCQPLEAKCKKIGGCMHRDKGVTRSGCSNDNVLYTISVFTLSIVLPRILLHSIICIVKFLSSFKSWNKC